MNPACRNFSLKRPKKKKPISLQKISAFPIISYFPFQSSLLLHRRKKQFSVFFIQFHGVTDAVHLLTSHERRAAAAKGVDHHSVLLRGVSDGITEQVEGLAGRVVCIALRLVKIPDGGLFPVGEPLMLPVGEPAVEHGLVLPLIWTAAQHQAVLHPDAYSNRGQWKHFLPGRIH